MDNKKIVAVSVLAVLALAFAGAGYAVYTAATYNAGNDIATEYITVTPDIWTPMTTVNDIEIDTYTYAENKILYKFTDDVTVSDFTEVQGFNKAVEVGSALTLTLDGAAKKYSDYKMTVTAPVGEVNNNGTGFVLYMKVTDGTTTEYYKVGNAITDVVFKGPVTVSLVLLANYDLENIAFPGEDALSGSSKAPATDKILGGEDGVTFVFKFVGNTLQA